MLRQSKPVRVTVMPNRQCADVVAMLHLVPAVRCRPVGFRRLPFAAAPQPRGNSGERKAAEPQPNQRPIGFSRAEWLRMHSRRVRSRRMRSRRMHSRRMRMHGRRVAAAAEDRRSPHGMWPGVALPTTHEMAVGKPQAAWIHQCGGSGRRRQQRGERWGNAMHGQARTLSLRQ
jgi:hypothetical protein